MIYIIAYFAIGLILSVVWAYYGEVTAALLMLFLWPLLLIAVVDAIMSIFKEQHD